MKSATRCKDGRIIWTALGKIMINEDFRDYLAERAGLKRTSLDMSIGTYFEGKLRGLSPEFQRRLSSDAKHLEGATKAIQRAQEHLSQLSDRFAPYNWATRMEVTLTELIRVSERQRDLSDWWPKHAKKPDAHLVAETVGYAYWLGEKEITYSPNEPKTHFCETVCKSLELLGVEGEWKRPCEAVHKRYQEKT